MEYIERLKEIYDLLASEDISSREALCSLLHALIERKSAIKPAELAQGGSVCNQSEIMLFGHPRSFGVLHVYDRPGSPTVNRMSCRICDSSSSREAIVDEVLAVVLRHKPE